jgi:hypothetical protein
MSSLLTRTNQDTILRTARRLLADLFNATAPKLPDAKAEKVEQVLAAAYAQHQVTEQELFCYLSACYKEDQLKPRGRRILNIIVAKTTFEFIFGVSL